MLCHVDFEFPEVFFSEPITCCARAWASPELALGASISEGWIIAWEKSPRWTVIPPAAWGTFSVAQTALRLGASGNSLCLNWAALPSLWPFHATCQGIEREGRSFSISSMPTLPQFESKSWWWLEPTVLLTIHGEQKPIPGRGDLKCPGAGVASKPFISTTQNSQQVLILDHLAKWSAQLQMSFSILDHSAELNGRTSLKIVHGWF